MSKITLRSLSAATGPTDGSTGVYLVNNGGPLTVDQVDYNFLNLNYGKLDKNLNLSDVQSVATTRTNLGLGTLAVYNAAGATGLGNIGATGLVTFTSGSTGALVVSGGAGINGNLAVGGTIYGNVVGNVTGNLTGNATTSSSTTGNAATATKLANTRTLWGQNFDGSANVTGSLSAVTTIDASGIITLTNTTASSTYLNGALLVSGGVGITGAVNTNNDITAAGTITARNGLALAGSPTPGSELFTIRDGDAGNVRFQVDSATGNTIIAGTLGASGALTAGSITGVGNVGATGIVTFSNLVGNGFVKASPTGVLSVDNSVGDIGTLAAYDATGATGLGNLGATGTVQFSNLVGNGFVKASPTGVLSIDTTVLGTLATYNAAGATGLGNLGASGIVTFGNLGTGFVKTTNGQLSTDTNTYLTGNQNITVSGVVSGSGTTSISTGFPNNAITGLGTLGSTGVVTFSEGSTGALIVRGGAGVTGNLTAAGTGVFGNIGSTGIVTLGGSTGALVVSGGVGIGGNLTVKGHTNLGTRLVLGNTVNQQELFLSGGGGSLGVGNNGNLVISVPESSIAYLNINGGYSVSFAASMTVGSQVNNALSISNPVTGGVFNLPAGSSTYTAATLEGVETLSNKTITSAGNIGASGITTLGGSTGALVVSGGVGIGGNVTAVGTANFGNIGSTGIVTFSNATITGGSIANTFGNIGSTGITTLGGSTGALVVSGGVGIGRNLTAVGTARFGNVGSTGFATLSNVTIAAGTATTAPLTFTSGTNLTNTVAGSVEYDGTVFYATPSSNFGRVSVSAPIFISGANTATLFDGSSQNIFAGTSSGGLTLPVGTYKFEFSINFNITGSTTADALSIDFCKAIGGRAVGSVAFTSTGGVNNTSTITGSTGVVYQTGATGLNVSIQITPSMNTNPRLYTAYGKGIIRVHTAGKVRPQYSITLTGATGILSSDNYMIITPLTSSNTATSTGAWS